MTRITLGSSLLSGDLNDFLLDIVLRPKKQTAQYKRTNMLVELSGLSRVGQSDPIRQPK